MTLSLSYLHYRLRLRLTTMDDISSPQAATQRTPDQDWPSGRAELKQLKVTGRWRDGRKIGRGHPQPGLQHQDAESIARRHTTSQGRPGGGWLKSIEPDDYINFQVKVPGRGRKRRLIVRVLDVTRHETFDEMVRAHGIGSLLPGGDLSQASIDAERELAAFYRTFRKGRGKYGDLERSHGAVGLVIEPLGDTWDPPTPAQVLSLVPDTPTPQKAWDSVSVDSDSKSSVSVSF